MPTTPEKVATQYNDVRKILDMCLAGSGGTFTAPSYSQAVLFRQRCYTFMKKYREALEAGASPYDVLVVRSLPPKKIIPDTSRPLAVKIEIRHLEGEFVSAGGDRVDTRLEEGDEFMAEALALRKSLNLD